MLQNEVILAIIEKKFIGKNMLQNLILTCI
jgi:hypothetical protein